MLVPQVIYDLWQICGSGSFVAILWQLFFENCGSFVAVKF